MFLTLFSEVTIGNIRFDHITEARVHESITSLSNTAIIVVPKNYNMRERNVMEYLHVGQPAVIKLGYDGELKTEFTGYVSQISSRVPIRIELEDEMYNLRKQRFTKAWENVSLSELLQFITGSYEVDADNVFLGKFSIRNQSAYGVLVSLKDKFGLLSYFDSNQVLNCHFNYNIRHNGAYRHTYNLSLDVRKNGNLLQYKRKGDSDIRIKAISTNLTGEKTVVTVGSDLPNASVRTLNFRNKTESELKELASYEFERLDFDGYEGSIVGFGTPQTRAGDTLAIVSDDKAKNGNYLINAVNIRYKNSTFSRKNFLGAKI